MLVKLTYYSCMGGGLLLFLLSLGSSCWVAERCDQQTASWLSLLSFKKKTAWKNRSFCLLHYNATILFSLVRNILHIHRQYHLNIKIHIFSFIMPSELKIRGKGETPPMISNFTHLHCLNLTTPIDQLILRPQNGVSQIHIINGSTKNGSTMSVASFSDECFEHYYLNTNF